MNNIKEYIITNKLVLVDFFTANCDLCMMGMFMLEQIAKDMKADVIVGKIDIDHAYDLSMDLGVKTTPSMILFKDGNPVAKMSGFRPASQIRDMINQFI